MFLFAVFAGSVEIVPAQSSAGEAIEPFLGIVRSQKEPFNGSCPVYNYADSTEEGELPMAGCVATAIESILTYYGYPDEVKDTLWGWQTDNYDVDTILPGTEIDYENILDVYTEGCYTEDEAQAVADLTYWAGIGVHMNWTPTASGADLANAASSLVKNWGYDYVRYISSVDYTPERWWELLDNELESGRPVIYSGYTALVQGHAFVVDGRDDEGRYHVCWGYGGLYDGYYDLRYANTYENPDFPTEIGRRLGHHCGQEMIFLYPDSVGYEKSDTVADALNGIEVEKVEMVREPDRNGYVETSVTVTNTSNVEREVLLWFVSYGMEETEPFENGQSVGAAGGVLESGETQTLVTYLSFDADGEQLLGISTGDTAFVWVDTLNVEASSGEGVDVACSTLEITSTTASFCVEISNRSVSAYSGRMLTYSMFEGAYTTDEGDWRQWDVLNLAPSASQNDTICFEGLNAGIDYTFVVRNTWLPAVEIGFTTPIPEGVTSAIVTADDGQAYDLMGRSVDESSKGVVLIKRGGRYIKIYNE